MLLKIAILTLVVIFLTGASETAKAIDTGNLKMYCWSGAGAGSYFDKPPDYFNKFFLEAVKIKQTTIDSTPYKQDVLDGIKDADVIYTSTHIGEQTGSLLTKPELTIRENGKVVIGPDEKKFDDRLTIWEIDNLYRNAPHLPSLVIINGCKSLREDLYKAFQITETTKGRAYIGGFRFRVS
jgi:hypothetical protein